jgi:dipeptidyl aminopeptidase/acylaminoacyl peptidase
MYQQRLRRMAVLVSVSTLLSAAPFAQSKQPPGPADWGQFESLAPQPRGGLSPDGKWLVYGVNRSNRENELRVRSLTSAAETVVKFGAGATFSSNSKWIAYSIGYSEAQEERMRAQRRPVQRKLGMLRLDGTSEPVTLDGIESFAFDPTGAYIVVRRYAPERPGASPAPAPVSPPVAASADDPPPQGVTVLVRELATGQDVTFGNVAESAWRTFTPGRVPSPRTAAVSLLALTISAEEKTGNGVHLYDPASGTHRVLDSASTIYSALAWRRDADDLVVLRAQADDSREGSTHVALAWTALSSATPKLTTLDPRKDGILPRGLRTVSFRRPSWSEDGRIVFLGIAPWEEKLVTEKPASGEKPTPGEKPASDEKPGSASPSNTPAEETASVDIWHARDIEVMPRQKLSARADRQRNALAAWHVQDGKLVQLGKDSREQVTLLRRRPLAYAATWNTYAMDRTIGRPAADVSLVDLASGERTKVLERIDDSWLTSSPGGRYLLFVRDGHYWTLDTKSRAVTNITRTVPTTFINRESDDTSKEKPPFGVAGWTTGDDAVLIYDKFDIWKVASDGSKAVRLTDGATEEVRYRYARVDPDEEFIDTSRPVFLSLLGIWSKKSGYAVASSSGVTRLMFEDKSIGSLAKARDAEVFAFMSQAFDDSPDIFVGAADLKSARQITATNPFLSKYAWGRSEVIEYKNARGERLQGALYYPGGYEPGKKYPMVVYLYEKLSDGVHRFVSPSERDYYNTSVFTSQGYVVFMPDIVFRPREPGLSVVECVEPAVKKVVAMGVADPARVGVVGHSWGGFDAAYLATHSNVFAASVAGAAITDLVSNYGNHHWSSGIAETDHIETGQQRMEVPLYEDLQAYIRNSAVFNVQNMKTPLMLMTGDSDGTVYWHQAVELYNIARRAKKQVVMLAYGGEDHSLRRKANQIDYQRRILQWFGHYLKNEPAAPWITSGMSFLEREQELKRAKAQKGS